MQTFKPAGCQVSDSQGNFIFVDVKRPAKTFRDACERMGVIIGRDFPPLTMPSAPRTAHLAVGSARPDWHRNGYGALRKVTTSTSRNAGQLGSTDSTGVTP